MPLTAEQREKRVTACVEDLVNSAKHDPRWLREIFTRGFPGFENMSDDELEQAYSDAGLDDGTEG